MVKVKTSVFCRSNGFDDKNQLNEAIEFIEIIKPFILGKELKEIFVSKFAYGTDTKRLPIIPIDHYIKRNKHAVAWEDYIVLIIGEEQLELNLWAPWQYKLGLNTLQIDEIKRRPSTHLIPVCSSNFDTRTLYDISEAYKENLIGNKVAHIFIESNFGDACEAVIIELDNGKSVKIYEDCDEVYIVDWLDSRGVRV